MNEGESKSLDCPFTNHAVIAGFGVPGRAVGELIAAREISYCVIELNPRTVNRCTNFVHIMAGDVRDEQTLRRAGIERATLFVVAIPNDAAVIEAVGIARKINPKVHIMARCHYISAGIEARRRGANEVVVEEQAVGEEFVRMLEQGAASLLTPSVR
jgi:CPA2 family monovalent cation:H+ antiporter-2